ncbi:uncharacterized protein METZ01_LOCUS457693, partial [marine metagenome]
RTGRRGLLRRDRHPHSGHRPRPGFRTPHPDGDRHRRDRRARPAARQEPLLPPSTACGPAADAQDRRSRRGRTLPTEPVRGL